MMKKSGILILTVVAFILINMTGCSKSSNDNPDGNNNPPPSDCSGLPGPLFSAVKTLIESKCLTCHAASIAQGGINFSESCNIVINRSRIKIRAVDTGSMPPTGSLSQSDKDKITAWINAGGRLTD